jgi:predicted oxidoreductase
MLAPTPDLRPLGRSALTVFPLAYGCWRFAGTSVSEARAKIDAALELGVTLFDHADIYGGDGAAEALFGAALAEMPRLRERMRIATKCGIAPGVPYDSSPAHIRASCEASLRRLRVETIDLYQIHRPDWLADPEETAEVLIALREKDMIGEVGVSNHTVAQVDALQRYLPFPLATQQPELSAWSLEPFRDGVIDQCLRERITPLAWSPLAGGRLGLDDDAARREPDGERLAALLACLDRLAVRDGVSRTAVALAFLLVHPAGIVPILGTQRVVRIRAARQAFDVKLTRRDWY